MPIPNFQTSMRPVLKVHSDEKGGTLMVTTSSHTQLRDRYRCLALIDDVVAALPRRFAPLGTLAALTDVAGMEPAGRFVPVDVVRER